MSVERSLLAVLLLVVISAIWVAHGKYQLRKDFLQVQALRAERDRLDSEWQRLMIEKGALSSPVVVEDRAARQLNMKYPTAADIRVLGDRVGP
jgi:cell division protein FtsL